jgi:PLATZ transcription factor
MNSPKDLPTRLTTYLDFFKPCAEHVGMHPDRKRLLITNICIDDVSCGFKPGCHMCKVARGKYLRIYRNSHFDVVRISDIRTCVDTRTSIDITGIQSYTINGAEVVFLRDRPVAYTTRPNTVRCQRCVTCGRFIKANSTYCSLRCKVQSMHDTVDKNAFSIRGLHRRKTRPHKAPLL